MIAGLLQFTRNKSNKFNCCGGRRVGAIDAKHGRSPEMMKYETITLQKRLSCEREIEFQNCVRVDVIFRKSDQCYSIRFSECIEDTFKWKKASSFLHQVCQCHAVSV